MRTVRDRLSEEVLKAYYLSVWNDVVSPICGGHSDYVLEDVVANHIKADYPATEWRFRGSLGFGGKLFTRTDMSCYVACYVEDETPDRLATIRRANTMLSEIYARLVVPALAKVKS